MKIVFIIQGEGRGHMTQAIALQDQLRNTGHEVSAALIGKSNRRTLPDFVRKKLSAELYQFDSPNFVTDPKEKSIRIWPTLLHNLAQVGQFKKSLQLIHSVVRKHQPDIIINFYDMLGGLYQSIYRPKAMCWAIGHQYLIHHPGFPFAPHPWLQRWMFQLNTYITALGADKLLALSFREMPAHAHPKLTVLPPLLRPEIQHLQPTTGDFILAYMVNPGYADELIAYAQNHPEVKIKAFWDRKNHVSSYQPLPNLTFHQIDDQLFLEKMAQCRGLISTAGFESICEAMYLGKKVMMVPVAGQYEQACNALDAVKAGAGISWPSFDIDQLNAFLKSAPATDQLFQNWQLQLDKKLYTLLESAKSQNAIHSPASPSSFSEQTLSAKS